MNTQLKNKLEKLRVDYQQFTGYPYIHFFCPILFRDEETTLCKAHIINQAFSNSTRRWTVQRKDVDEFFGANFESEFVAIQYKENQAIGKTLVDKKLYNTFTPKISIDGKHIEFFIAHGDIPNQFTPVLFENDDGRSVLLGLKISSEKFKKIEGKNIEIDISKDLRVPSIVSLIKAAHLTLFEMLGYRYALSAAGLFTGREILGKFFEDNHNKSKSETLANALPYFREFTHMARPILSEDIGIKGTITDGLLFLCRSSRDFPWAFIIFIKTSQMMHAVMIPILDEADKAKRFYSFLQGDNETVEGSYCKFVKGHWEIDKESISLIWPKTGTLYPN